MRENDCPELGPPRLAHLAANEYVKHHYLSQELFDTYFKFAFVRNPWCRTVSMYYYFGFDAKISFNDFVVVSLPELFRNYNWFVKPQSEFIYFNNKLMVDFVGKYENLQSDFNTICNTLHIEPSVLTHRNKSKKRFNNYRDYYTSISKDLVYKLYRQDFDFFKYEF
jgi:hypothetical protein